MVVEEELYVMMIGNVQHGATVQFREQEQEHVQDAETQERKAKFVFISVFQIGTAQNGVTVMKKENNHKYAQIKIDAYKQTTNISKNVIAALKTGIVNGEHAAMENKKKSVAI